MINDYAKKYAKEIAEGNCSPADGLFHADYIRGQYEWGIWDKLTELGLVQNERGEYRLTDIDWDEYDRSIELIGCEDGFTMTTAQHDAICAMGFSKIFVNYRNHPENYGNRTPATHAMPVIKDV